MRVLPDDLRNILKKPIGQLVNEKKLLKLIKNKKYIVTIGDIVTYTVLKNDIKPVFCIVDYKTRRGNCSKEIKNMIKSNYKKKISVENPAGTITDDLWNIIKKSLKNLDKKGFLIEVKGEEDLASLAVIFLAPPNVTIIYGLPDKGVLVVKPTSENKILVKQILDMM